MTVFFEVLVNGFDDGRDLEEKIKEEESLGGGDGTDLLASLSDIDLDGLLMSLKNSSPKVVGSPLFETHVCWLVGWIGGTGS